MDDEQQETPNPDQLVIPGLVGSMQPLPAPRDDRGDR